MTSLSDVLRLLGARWDRRAEIGWDSYVYKLPNGEEITTGPRGKWTYSKVDGSSTEELWRLAWPKVCDWNKFQEAKAKAEADAKVSKVRALLESVCNHMNAIDWTCTNGAVKMELRETPNGFRKYPLLEVIEPDRRPEIWCEFNDDGSILSCSVAQKFGTGLPSIRKRAASAYDYNPKG
jgi:hypothetical protein